MATGAESRRTVRVLHVDDDPSFADLTATFLERTDDRFDVATATSASDGLEMVRSDPPDCIVSDYDMPAMDGLELLTVVREERSELPFILFTGKGSEEIASEAISAGVTDYLQKTPGTDQYAVLANRIRNAVDGYRARRDARSADRRLRRIYERITDAVVAIDADWRCTYVNSEAERLLGLEFERSRDPIGESIWTVGPSLAGTAFEDRFRTAMETQETASVVAYVPSLEAWLAARIYPDEDGISVYFRDVTERRAEEQALRRCEALIEGMDDAVFMFDSTGTCTYVNAAAVANGSHTREEILGSRISQLPWNQAVDEDELAAYQETIWQLLDGERTHAQRTLELSTKETETGGAANATDAGEDESAGETKIIHVHLSRVESDDGTVVGVVGVARDVTDRVRRDREVRARTAAMEAATDGIAILDENEEYVFVNRAHAEVYGYDDADAFLGSTWRMCCSEADVERFEREVMPVLFEEGAWRGDTVGRRADGSAFPIELSLTALPDGGLICVVRDVTERKERERELRETTRQLQGVLDTVSAAIFVKDLEGRYLVMNQNCRTLLGVDDETDAVGAVDEDFFPDEVAAQFRANDRRVLETGRTIEIEEAVPTPDGTRTHLTCKTPIVDDGGDPYAICAVSTDITEHKDRERELERQNERLEEFAGIVSHDLRNPLTIAQSYLELARERGEPGRERERGDEREVEHEHEYEYEYEEDDTERDALEEVGTALDRMAQIVERTLTLARSGRTIGTTESVDLTGVARRCWRNVDTGNAVIRLERLPTVDADPGRLQHLFENVFRNAVEHGSTSPASDARENATERAEPGVTGTVTVTVGPLESESESGGENEDGNGNGNGTETETGFYVEDDGPGLSDEAADIFDPNYSTGGEGIGFGLTIVEQIVDAHGWTIRVAESASGGLRLEITTGARATDSPARSRVP